MADSCQYMAQSHLMLPLLVQYFSILFQNFLRITKIFRIYVSILVLLGFLGGVVLKNPPPNAGDMGSIPGLGMSFGVGNGNPLQYSCQENSMDRGVWRAKVHGVAKSRTQLSDWKYTYTHTLYVINSLYITHSRLLTNGCWINKSKKVPHSSSHIYSGSRAPENLLSSAGAL